MQDAPYHALQTRQSSLMRMKQISRRLFVRTAAAGVALPYFIPASVLGAAAPSRKITIGFIGVGDHGTGWNLDRYLKLPAARVLMVCDVRSEEHTSELQLLR